MNIVETFDCLIVGMEQTNERIYGWRHRRMVAVNVPSGVGALPEPPLMRSNF